MCGRCGDFSSNPDPHHHPSIGVWGCGAGEKRERGEVEQGAGEEPHFWSGYLPPFSMVEPSGNTINAK
jgi:hypothetical protein